jgi:hypothetical protein
MAEACHPKSDRHAPKVKGIIDVGKAAILRERAESFAMALAQDLERYALAHAVMARELRAAFVS